MHNVSVPEILQLERHAFSFLSTNWTYIQKSLECPFTISFVKFRAGFHKRWWKKIEKLLAGKTREDPICQTERCQRQGWTWKSCILSDFSDRWCTILPVTTLALMSAIYIWSDARIFHEIRPCGKSWLSNLLVNTWTFVGQIWPTIGFTEWVISYQAWSICACQIKVQGCMVLYCQAYRTLSLQKLNIEHWIEIEHIEHNSKIE